MSVRKTLPLSGAAHRFVVINLLVLSLYNPSEFSAVALVRAPEVPFWARLAVLAAYGVVLAALGRQAWCGFRALGPTVAALLIVGSAASVWTLADALLGTAQSAMVTGLLVASIVLSVGQVAAYYTRQLSGQSPVLKHPP